jgi:hypothetical protein
MGASLANEHGDRESHQDAAQPPRPLLLKEEEDISQAFPALERQGYAQC